MTINSKIEIPDTLLLQKVDDETILLDSNTQEYFSLNEIGTLIWELVSEKSNLEEVKKEISTIYEVDEKQVETDILSFLKEVENKGLIKID